MQEVSKTLQEMSSLKLRACILSDFYELVAQLVQIGFSTQVGGGKSTDQH